MYIIDVVLAGYWSQASYWWSPARCTMCLQTGQIPKTRLFGVSILRYTEHRTLCESVRNRDQPRLMIRSRGLRGLRFFRYMSVLVFDGVQPEELDEWPQGSGVRRHQLHENVGNNIRYRGPQGSYGPWNAHAQPRVLGTRTIIDACSESPYNG